MEQILSFKEALVYGVEESLGKRIIGMHTLGLGDAVGGLHTDDFIVITARGGTGKTYLMLQIAYDLSTKKTPERCAFFSGEMCVEDLASTRLIKLHDGTRTIKENAVPSEKIERIQQIGDIPMFFPVIEERWPFKSRCIPVMDRLREEFGVTMFFFDHLKFFMNQDSLDARTDERLVIEQTVLDMRLYAKKHKTPIFLAVQPKQISADEEVTSDSLKGTSAIGQDATVTIVLDKPRLKGKEREEKGQVYADFVNLKIEKARHGRGNLTIRLKLIPEMGRFVEFDSIESTIC